MSDLVERLREHALGIAVNRTPERLMLESADRISTLEAELEKAREALELAALKVDRCDGLDGAACALIREKLDDFGAPRAAFIDDHVGNGIAHGMRLAREAALEEAARLIEEGFDRPGILKKQDTCAHGKFGWEDCEMCAAAAIRALSQDKEARE